MAYQLKCWHRRSMEKNRSGHRGRAIDRDLTDATRCAEQTRKLWAEMRAAVGSEVARRETQEAYLEWLGKLLAELEREGEPDFDGQLRSGVNFLEGTGERVTY